MGKLAAKLVLLTLIVAALQSALFRTKMPKNVLLLERRLREGVDVVYMADSSNRAYSPQDTDRRPISTMLADELGGAPLAAIGHDAYQMDVYLAYCRFITRQVRPPAAVVIPVNMRTFSASWDLRPAWQFEKERFVLAGPFRRSIYQALYKPLGVFKAVKPSEVSPQEYYDSPVYDGAEKVGVVRDFDNPSYRNVTGERIARKLVFHYMYELAPEHRKVRSMVEIPRLLAARGVRSIFYVTPIDHETGRRYLGERFSQRLEANVALVLSLLQAEGAETLDLSTALGAGDFCWKPYYPNEHINQRGRSLVARRLARTIARDSVAPRPPAGSPARERSAAPVSAPRPGGGG